MTYITIAISGIALWITYNFCLGFLTAIRSEQRTFKVVWPDQQEENAQ